MKSVQKLDLKGSRRKRARLKKRLMHRDLSKEDSSKFRDLALCIVKNLLLWSENPGLQDRFMKSLVVRLKNQESAAFLVQSLIADNLSISLALYRVNRVKFCGEYLDRSLFGKDANVLTLQSIAGSTMEILEDEEGRLKNDVINNFELSRPKRSVFEVIVFCLMITIALIALIFVLPKILGW